MTLNDVLVVVLADLVLLLLADLAMYNEEVIVVVDDSPSPSVPPSTTVSTIILMDEEDASLVAVNSLPVNHTIRYSIYGMASGEIDDEGSVKKRMSDRDDERDQSYDMIRNPSNRSHEQQTNDTYHV